MAGSKHKIIFVLPSLLIGGIEKQVVRLIGALNKDKFRIAFVLLFKYEGKSTVLKDLPKNVPVFEIGFKSFYDLKSWFALFMLLRSLKPDVVVSSMFSANTAARFLKIFLGYKNISREHNIYFEKTFLQRTIDHFLSYISSAIVAVSMSVKDFFSHQAKVSSNKITVIYNGIDQKVINAFVDLNVKNKLAIKTNLGFDEKDKIILHVARLKKQKNQYLLIESFAKFHDQNKDWKLAIVGDGIERKNLEEFARKMGIEKSIKFFGFRDDVFSFYLVSDFFMLTSDIEGFPNVGLEAMAFGLPMISTRVSGVDEFLVSGENGFLVERDVRDIVQKMNIVARHNEFEKRTFAEHCRKTAARFSLDKTVRAYEKLLDQLLNK